MRRAVFAPPVARHRKFNDHPFPYRAELELEISTLTNLGVGLGRVALPNAECEFTERGETTELRPSADPQSATPIPELAVAEGRGWVVMVPFALPGERVRVRVFRNHKNYSDADLVAVLRPSPQRIAPRCPLFGVCGGCQYQNLRYSEQLAWKQRHVAELLRHMARLEFPVNPVIPSPREFGYRSKITPHFECGSRKAEGGEPSLRSGESEVSDRLPVAIPLANPPSSIRSPQSSFPIGFLKAASRFSLVDVPQCPIATDAINARLPEVRAEIRVRAAAGVYQRGATVLLRHSLEGVTTDYEATVTEEIVIAATDTTAPIEKRETKNENPALRLRFLARDFFQNNPSILPAFAGYVGAQAAAAGAHFLVDAYCGSGLFALSAAPRFERVTGVEISATSVKWAQENATTNGIAHATFRVGDAAAIFTGLDFPAAETAVVIDPPRRGCDDSFLRQLVAFGPRTIVYVSCDPATQMRDLAALIPAGYELTAVQPFDLFPQTRHLECVITLRKT